MVANAQPIHKGAAGRPEDTVPEAGNEPAVAGVAAPATCFSQEIRLVIDLPPSCNTTTLTQPECQMKMIDSRMAIC